ncbi:MAG: hypothetical protein QOG82_689 [Actinomycetota bacterium]|nr:hypothetical protein [Actinomycetota bacterium]
MRSEESLATVLLVGRLASGGLLPLKASEFWALRDQVGEVRTLLGRSERILIEEHGLSPPLARRVAGLLGRATAVAFEVERLDQSGISTLTPSDDAYPRRLVDRLGAKAPPVLHAAGAIDLLQVPGIGVVGEVGSAAAAAAVDGLAARRRLPLVSGGLRTSDGAGSSVVWVLAEPLVRTLRRPEVRRAVYRGATVICTPYGPDTPFTPANARGRDKLVFALAEVTLVVACDREQGHAWSDGAEAIAEGYGRVAVWRGDGEGPGNEALEARGATRVESIEAVDALLDGRERGGQ